MDIIVKLCYILDTLIHFLEKIDKFCKLNWLEQKAIHKTAREREEIKEEDKFSFSTVRPLAAFASFFFKAQRVCQ